MQRTTPDIDGTAIETDLLTRIRELVLSGTYEPGMALSEVRLAEHFDVSRTPIREALKQLQIEGLVEIRPKVGTFVRQASRREIVELFELKEVLEGMAARLLAKRGPTAELRTLEDNVAASEQAVVQRDSETYAGLVKEFHETLVSGADNQKLTQHYRTLMNQLAYHRFVRSTVEHPGRLRQSVAEHRTVLELIEQKDGVGAEIAMRRHVGSAAYEVLSDPPSSH